MNEKRRVDIKKDSEDLKDVRQGDEFTLLYSQAFDSDFTKILPEDTPKLPLDNTIETGDC